ncbi:MAG: endonuclease/exonuclease/phosphatase family protein [Pseudomonadota bacterium]|nr:endonuclease/exonuclease/phosphatase family protein [Pseudomonadota bacterium]
MTPHLSIVTWNVEWRHTTSKAAEIIRQRIFAHDPDVICLTEAPADFLRNTGHVIEAEGDYGYALKGNRRKVLLWSKQPWREEDRVGHPALTTGRYIAGRTETPAGELLVVGVCIPWSGAHVVTGRRDRKRWEDHLQYLEGVREALQPHGSRSLVVGDYNQAIPRRTAPVEAYEALDAAILRRFDLATAGEIAPLGGYAIDHVAHTPDLVAEEVVGLSPVGPSGEKLSDHFGLAVKLRAASKETAL